MKSIWLEVRLFVFVLVLSLISVRAICQLVIPHPVPEEFSSAYYEVTVNGQKVPVFHAGLNVYFASFDFTGNVDVLVTSNLDKSGHLTFIKQIKYV